MKRWALWMALAIWATAWNADARSIRMKVDEGEAIYEAGFAVSRMNLQGDQFVGVELIDKKVKITPLAPGRAHLTLYDTGGAVREEWQILISERVGPSVEAVEAFLRDESGQPIPTLFCKAIPGSDMIEISGLIREPFHMERIRKAEQTFEGAVVNLAKVDPMFFENMTEEIRKRVPIPGIQVSSAGERVFLTGMAFSNTEKLFVEAIARAIYPNVDSFINVRPEGIIDRSIEKPLIQLECQILEITHDAARQVGIDWGGMLPMTITAGWTSERGGGSPSGFVSINTKYLMDALIPQIQDGSAKVLYTQNLVCENAEEARFFAGGSFWITATVPGSGEVSVEEVEFGISMELQPTADKFNNIGTKVNIEFSNLGPSINDYPSLLKRYVRTSVNVKRGQTLSLGSLLGSDMRESTKKIAVLGDIPVLGELFKSKRYQEGKSEMVILITPRVVVPGDPENVGLRDQVERSMQK